jgi:hypothetical protein
MAARLLEVVLVKDGNAGMAWKIRPPLDVGTGVLEPGGVLIPLEDEGLDGGRGVFCGKGVDGLDSSSGGGADPLPMREECIAFSMASFHSGLILFRLRTGEFPEFPELSIV